MFNLRSIIMIIITILYALELAADCAAVKFEDGTILGVVISLAAGVAGFVQAYVLCHIGYYADKAREAVDVVKAAIAALKARVLAAFSHEEVAEPEPAVEQTHGKDMRGEMACRMAWKELSHYMRLEHRGILDERSQEVWAALGFWDWASYRHNNPKQGRKMGYCAWFVEHHIPSYAEPQLTGLNKGLWEF